MNLGTLVVKLLLERAQFKSELAQTVQDVNAAANQVQGRTAAVSGAVTDAITGQTTAVQTATRALTVLGPVAATAAAAALAVGLAYHQAQQETRGYEKAIVLTGNAADVTAGQLGDMAKRIDGVVGTQANAAAALTAMTAGGKVARENLEKVALAAVEMERATGQAISETEKIFSSLGKEPVKASLRLNESLNYLTAGTYAQIKAAENLGDTERAVSIAQNAAADMLRDRAAKIEKNLGTMERAWRGVRDLAKEAWDAMLNIGRPDSSADQLSKAGERVAYLEKQVEGRRSRGMATGDLDGQLAAAKALHDTLRETARLDERAAGIKADLAAKDKARLELALALEQSASKQEKLAIAIAQANALADRSGASAAERAQLVNAAREKYAEKESQASRDARKELEREAALLSTLSGVNADYQEQLKRLQLIRDKGNISEARYIELVTALIAKQPMAKQLMDEQTKATTAAEKATAELAKVRDHALAAQAKELEKMRAAVTAQQEQNARLGLTKEAITELDAAKLDMLATDLDLQAIKAMDKNLDEQQYEMLRKQAQAYRDLAQAKRDGAARQVELDREADLKKEADKAAKEFERASERIEQSLTDALMRGFEAGKDFAKNMRDTVVNMFKTMVLRPVVSAIVSPVAGAITGMLGLGGTSAGQSGGGSAASTAMSAASLFGAGGMAGSLAAGAGWLTGATTLGGSLTAGMSLLGTGTAAGAASGLGMLAGALGPIVIGIALLSSLIKKSTPHMGGGSSYSAADGLVTGAGQYTTANYGLADTRTYDAAAGKLTGDLARTLVTMLDTTATTFGKEAGYRVATAFADDKSKDGAWGQLLIEQMGKKVADWRDTQTDAWAPKVFSDGEAGSKEYLAAYALSARDALVQAIGDVDWARDMLQALGDSPTLENLAGTVDQINSARAAFVQFGKLMPEFAGLSQEAVSKMAEAVGGAGALVRSMDVFTREYYSDAERQAVLRADLTAEFGKLGFSLPKTRDELKALIEAQWAMGEGGAATAGKLVQLSEMFASLTQSADDARNAAFSSLQRSVDAQKRLLDSQRQAAESVVSELSGLFDLLHENVRSLYGEVESTRGMLAQQGSDFIAQALAVARSTGYLPDADKLAEAIGDVRAGLDASNFASSEERGYAALVLAGQLSGLEDLAGQQLTDAKRTVYELEKHSKQLDQTLDYWQQQIDLASGTYEAILGMTAAVDGLSQQIFNGGSTTKPPTAGGSGGGGGSGYVAGGGYAQRVGYGAEEALGSFEKFKAWYDGLRHNADPNLFKGGEYDVPDWMRMTRMAADGTDKELFGQYLFYKNNPQYAQDYEQIMTAGRSSFATDGSTLIRSDLSKMPGDAADFFRGDTASLLSYEGMGIDPVLGYQLYKYGPEHFGLNARGTNFTEWLRTHKWTEDGVIENNNAASLNAAGFSNYRQARWDTITGNLVNVDGQIYTPDGRPLGTASRAQMAALYGAAFVGTSGSSYGEQQRSSLYNQHVANGASEADYYAAIRTNLDREIANGITAQGVVDAMRDTGASMHDVAAAYNITVAQLEENLRTGGATGIPGFAGGGDHAGGLRIVGERGWELEATGPSRIWNQQQIFSALTGGGNTDRLEAVMKDLTAEVAALKAAATATANNTGRSADVLVAVKNGNSLVTTAVPTF